MVNKTPWPSVRLVNIANEVTVGYVGPMTSEYRPNGIPFLRSKNVKPFTINLDDIRYISDEFHHRIKKSRLTPGDVLIVRTGVPGATAVIPNWLPEANCADVVLVRPSSLLNAHYLAYFVNTVANYHVSAHTVGAVQQHFNVGSAKELLIPLPSRQEQDAIVAVLRAFDGKIELNLKMNDTLEAMAQALFKSWFVDFDPVIAKATGRKPYGMNEATSALFPDRFAESELGLIPEGWRIGHLDDLLILQRGFDLPAMHRREGSYPILAASGFSGTHDEFKVNRPGVTTGRSGLIGKVFFVHENFWPLNTSLWIKEFRISRPVHAYHLLKELDFETFNAGSAVPTLNRNHVHNLQVVIPNRFVIEAFEELGILLFQKCHANEKESLRLASLRDALLPKLLSGEIRVRQAEKLVAEAV